MRVLEVRFRLGVLSIALGILLSLSSVVCGSEPKITLELFHMTFIPAAQKVINSAIEAFEATHPNVEVKQAVVNWENARSQLVTSVMAGMAPDIAELPADWALDYMLNGGVLPLEELVSAEVIDSFVAQSLKSTSLGGHIYGLGLETSPTGLYYRKDLFEQAGLDPQRPPQNWDELVTYAKKLTRDRDGDGEIDQWGLVFEAGGFGPDCWCIQYLYESGTPIVKQSDGEWHSDFLSEEAIRGLQFYYDLVNTYKVTPPGVTGMTWEDAKNMFVFGDAAMMINGMFVFNLLKDSAPALIEEGKVGTAMMPAGPTGVRASIVIPNSLFIMAQSKHPKEAAEFLEFFYGGIPSYATQYALAIGVIGLQKQFAEIAELEYPELVQPFIASVEFGYSHPLAPNYGKFREMALNPTLQRLLRDQIKPEEAARYLHEQLERLLSSG